MAFVSLALIGARPGETTRPPNGVSDELRKACFAVLTGALRDESPWVRVHAAEALVSQNRPEPTLAVFRPESQTTKPQYRIVVWRVLAAAEPEPERRHHYVQRIRAALLDPHGPDQTHAMEALAKLREPAADDAERRCIADVADGKGPASPFAVWRLAQAGDRGAVHRLQSLLQAEDATTRARAAYVLSRLDPITDGMSAALSAALANEPADSPARPMIRAALGGESLRQLAGDTKVSPSGRYIAATLLAERGSADDLDLLRRLLNDADADVRVGAAHALLRIDGRITTTSPGVPP